MRYQELCFGAFVLGAAIAFDDGRHSRNMRLKPDVFQPETPPPSNSLTTGVWGEVSFGLPSRTGDESISRYPSGVPVLDSFTAHGAFKAADLARFCDVFAAVINRAALASSMDTDHRTSSPPHDPATRWRPTAPRDSPLEGVPGKICQPRFLHSGEKVQIANPAVVPRHSEFSLNPHPADGTRR